MRLRERANQLIANEYSLIFCMSIAMLFCMSFKNWVHFDIPSSVDPKTYWGLAHFDFEQSMVRKYRIIIPFLVALLNWMATHLIHLVRPDKANGDFVMQVIFYCINLLCSAAWCTLVYAYIRALGKSKWAALVGPLIILVAWWTPVLTGEYMVDTFYCCFIALALLGMATKNSKMIFWSIMIGPFAKENFMFFLPVIVLYSHIPKWKTISWIALCGILIFSYRYLYDHVTGHAMKESLDIQAEHFTFLISNSHRFMEYYWLQDIAATIGLWWLVPVAVAWLTKGFGQQLKKDWKGYMTLWGLLVLLQMLMSGDLSRMLYLFLPVYAVLIAVSIDHYSTFLRLRQHPAEPS